MILSIFGYVADAAILATYVVLVRGNAIWFHWANALGAIPLVGIEVIQHAWPVVPLTSAFGCLGAYGVVQHYRQRNVGLIPLTQADIDGINAHFKEHERLAREQPIPDASEIVAAWGRAGEVDRIDGVKIIIHQDVPPGIAYLLDERYIYWDGDGYV